MKPYNCKRKWLSMMVLGLALCLAMAGPARADPIGGPNSDCVSCQGSVYWLLYTSAGSADPAFDIYNLILRIDTSDYTGVGVAIDTVAIKVANSIAEATLTSAPGGLDDWVLKYATLNANGCGAGGGGWACAQEIELGNAGYPSALVKQGTGILEWGFNVKLASGSFFDDPDEASIKARYVDANGNKVGALVSENITAQAVPEPVSFEILGWGLLAAVAFASSRLRRNRRSHAG